MDLSRAIGKFTTTPLLGWNPVTKEWDDTNVCGSLSVFDRFVTQRTFGQKKRVLLTDRADRIPAEFGIIKLQGGSQVFLLEGVNEDVADAQVYNLTYLIHEASTLVEIRQHTTTTRASGVEEVSGDVAMSQTWADIEKFTSRDSSEFSEVDYTVNLIALSKNVIVTTDQFIQEVVSGAKHSIDEIYPQLNTTVLKSRVMGVS